MGIDELAKAVREGQADILSLWGKLRRFAYSRAVRWSGVEIEDLMQAAFLALLDTLRRWEPEGGTFIGLYALRLKTAFSEARGVRSVKQSRDPLHNAESIDAPMGEEDFTLSDALPDPAAEADFCAVEERDYIRRLHSAEIFALTLIPPDQAEAIEREFFRDGERAPKKLRDAALRNLRHPTVSRHLKPYYVRW